MLLVVWCIECFFGDDVILRGKLVELGVVECLSWVFCLVLSFLNSLLSVRLFPEHGSFLGKFALQFSGLGVEPVIEVHLFAEVR